MILKVFFSCVYKKKKRNTPGRQTVTIVKLLLRVFHFLNYYQNASIIGRNLSTPKDAPPIKPPSTSGFENNSFALEALQLPP